MDLSGAIVLCVGDVMLDRFAYCDMERISPEAPVPVLSLVRERQMLGGSGNVAANVAALGGRAILVGAVGRDDAAGRVRALLAGMSGIEPALLEAGDRPTICKIRYIAGHQHVVRTDHESRAPLPAEDAAALLALVIDLLPRAGSVVLSDYGKGALSPATIAAIVAAASERSTPTFVDPKSAEFADYLGAACLTPNLRELAVASRMPVASEAEVVAAARFAMARAGAGAVLATRSEKGMVLVESDGGVHSVPARAREVFDVSGAGDTVVATMAACAACGMTLPQAMRVANAAAGVVVGKSGTATATMVEVLREMGDAERDEGPPPRGIVALDNAIDIIVRWKRQGLSVGFANGCFDVLHPGHVALLARARSECDRLVVALNDDAGVRALKGPGRPVNDLGSRASVIAALRDVDCVVSFGEPTPIALIQALLPDVLVKGADYSVDQVVGADVVMSYGGRVVLADLVAGHSSTGSIARIAAAAR